MNSALKQFQLVLIFPLLACNDVRVQISDRITPSLITKDTANEYERNNTLFVFVGEKIDFDPILHKQGRSDKGVHAKYKIIQKVYGNYDKDIIEFEAYDHYEVPAFTKFQNSLLFVSEYKGKFYQEKYMYDPLFKTADGRWAGPYSIEYGHPYNQNTAVKPEKIDFAQEVSFPIIMKDNDGKEFRLYYPKPYYKIVGDKAIAVYGNFIIDLFKLKKESVLTARGLFSGKKEKEAWLEKNRDSSEDEF